MTAPPRLRAAAVTKVYADSDESSVDALRGVDLTIETGEFVAVTGPSGCGKSTLLHVLGALDVPTSGEVFLNETPLSALDRTALAEIRNLHVGFVFQSFHLMPALTAFDNVMLPVILAGRRPRDYRARVDGLLASVNLSEKADRYPAQLSGGEQQRVAIARALVMSPSVLLADEPTGNLDTETGAQIIQLLRQCHDSGQTIVLVTHDVKVAGHANRVVFMRDGMIVGGSDLGRDAGLSGLERLIQFGGDDLS